jgi:PPM family protein phosphatase
MTDLFTGSRCEGASTTLASIRFVGSEAHVVSVGDSRVYRLRADRLDQISVDHTIALQMVRDGLLSSDQVETMSSIYSDLASSITASEFESEFDVFHSTERCESGDIWLCCSDGLTCALNDPDIEDILRTSDDSKSMVSQLIDKAMSCRNSDDNISAIVVRCMNTDSAGGG